MKKKYYLPVREDERAVWLNNFITRLNGGFATLFGISPGDMSLLADFLMFYIALVAQLDVAKQGVQELTKYKRAFCNDPKGSPLAAYAGPTVALPTLPSEGGLWAYIRAMVKAIKAHPAYTTSIGEALRVIGEDHDVDIDNSKPVLTFVKEPHGWRIEFGLLNFFDGISIYKKMPSATDFTHLATDRHSPYIDNSPVENGTQYYAFFLIGDDEVGLQSEISTLKVTS